MMLRALRSDRSLLLVWLGLVIATATGAVLFESGRGLAWVTVGLFVLAGAKVVAIFGRFMELWWAPRPLATFCALWTVAVIGVLCVGFLAA